MKGYERFATVLNKDTAKYVAVRMRESGYSVRIVKETTKYGNYSLYRKKK